MTTRPMRRSKPYIEGCCDPEPKCRSAGIDMTLTERQAEIVEFVRGWWAEHGYGPSMQDIADGLSVSRGFAFRMVKLLVDKGALRYEPRIRRSTRLPELENS